MSSSALVTVAPNASAIAWCPRQMPSSGVPDASAAVTVGIETPASEGFPGPGDTSTASYSEMTPAMSTSAWSSLRITTVSAPSCCRYPLSV